MAQPTSAPAPSPYVAIERERWSSLRDTTPLTLDDEDLARLRGLGEPIDLTEVEEVYLPLSRLLSLQVTAAHERHRATSTFLGEGSARVPFVIGVAGSVAVGKSTTSRVLRELLARWPHHPQVELVTTDGFLLPNAELERRGILARKGFPESYDQRALLRFLAAVKSGAPEVVAPLYSHLVYDVVPGGVIEVRSPDILVVEGLNVLQPPRPRADGRSWMSVSDYFDFSVYVDAATVDVRRWYVERFLRLRRTAFADPASYFHRYAALSDEAARETALSIWAEVNEPNLVQNILPTRGRATLVLEKGPDHAVRRVRLRKL
ncbi:MAG: type pantothenate kinase [Actinomycetota bacterium]|nr:type pantothenate kinase [Actinomycetota bacterium]